MSEKVYTIGDQFLATLMMALQKCLIEQTDIKKIIDKFQVVIDDNGELVVKNPPTFTIDTDGEDA